MDSSSTMTNYPPKSDTATPGDGNMYCPSYNNFNIKWLFFKNEIDFPKMDTIKKTTIKKINKKVTSKYHIKQPIANSGFKRGQRRIYEKT